MIEPTSRRGSVGAAIGRARSGRGRRSEPRIAEAGESSAIGADLVLRTDERFTVSDVTVGPRSELVGRQLPDLFAALGEPLVAVAERCLHRGTVQRCRVAARAWSADRYLLRLTPYAGPAGQQLAVSGIIDDQDAGHDLHHDAPEHSVLHASPGDPLWELIEHLPLGVFVKDLDYRFTYGNRTLLDALGLRSVEELQGRVDGDMAHAPEADGYREVDRSVVEEGRIVVDMHEEQTRSDGTVELLRTTKIPVRDADGSIVGLIGCFAEVTEGARVAEALRTSEKRFALAVRASRDGIWDYDLDTNSFLLSARACELLDLPPSAEPVPWLQMAEIFGPDEAPGLIASVEALRRDPTKIITHSAAFHRADGSIRWLEMNAAALAVGGETRRIIGSATDVTDERRREAELRHQALTDQLTGLPNRRAVLEEVERLLADRAPFSLLYLDLDGFKVVNDSLGHDAGDALLQAVGTRIGRLTGPADLVGRLGGDEFAVVLAGPDHRQRAIELAKHGVGQALLQPILLGGLERYTAASVGVVLDSAGYRSSQAMLRDADTAMYRAKTSQAGYRIFEPAMAIAAVEELELQTRLRRAVDDHQLELHYQPIFDAESSAVVALEGLLRWRPEPDELVPPDRFLPYLERSGLIVPVGAWVVDEGCRQLAAWRSADRRFDGITLAVNLSRIQFDAPGLVETIAGALDRHGLPPSALMVEITESAGAGDADRLVGTLAKIRDLGVKIALDDFGVGQSSLSQLNELPLDTVKIDRTFVARISDRREEPVLEATLRMVDALGLSTVAEGVETAEQVEWLRARGCGRLQGFGLSRPVPAELLPAKLDPA